MYQPNETFSPFTGDLNDAIGGHGAALGVDANVGAGDVTQFFDFAARPTDDGTHLRLMN